MTFIDTISNFSFLGFTHWSYVIIFLGALLEAVPLFGLLAPGMALVVAGGFMVKLGLLDWGDLLVIASLGAILGDVTGYFLGRKYGESFLKKYGKYFFFHQEQYDKTKRLINNHTGKSIIIGRFNSLTRAFAPFIAGSTNVPWGKFMMYNIIGGVAWSVSFVTVGYVFGQSYEAVSGYIGKFVTIAVIVGIGIVYLYRFVNKRRHIFSRYHLYTLILNLFSLYLFSKMVEDVIDQELVTHLDVWVNQHIVSLWGPVSNEVMLFITNLASPLHLTLFAVLLFGFLLAKKSWYYATLLFFGMSGGAVLMELIKLLMHRERPLNSLITETGFSFPSGHATMAIIFFVTVLLAFKDRFKHNSARLLFICTTVLAFLFVGFSRIYLNVHWFSDVIAGFALGLFWLTLLVLIFKFIIATFSRVKDGLKKFWLSASPES